MIPRICKTAPLAALLLGATCFGYIREVTNFAGDTSPVLLFRIDNTAIQFNLNSGVVAGAQSSASGNTVTVISANSNPVAAFRAALATWNAAGTANVAFLPLQSNSSLGIDSTDGKMVIAIGSTAADISAVGPALAVTVNVYPNGTGVLDGVNATKGAIVDSDIILNPAIAFSTDGSTQFDLQSVALHEFGHSLGANHAGMLGASMFQSPTQRFLSADDLAFTETVYPLANPVALGTINGSVTAGGTGLPYALLTAFDTSAGVTIGGITNPDGTYSFNVPPGNYQVYAEPLNGVDTINIYLTAAQVALAGATKFQTTVARGSYPIAANGSATVNIAVTTGAAGLATPYAAEGPVGSTPAAFYTGAALTVPSGGSVDLMFAGKGFDSTLSTSNFAFYGKGVTLQSVKVDNTLEVAGFNLLRVTVNVPATTTPNLASFTVTTPTGTISFSGALVIVPPTPSTTSQSIISAASFVGNGAGNGAVSPGGEYALYPGKNASIGPVTGVSNPPNFDAYGNLPTILGGVSVTFDGVPAPLFYVSAAQINLQVPFEVAGKTTTSMIVNYLGSPSPAVNVPVLPVQPALYTANYSGTGPVIAFHLKDGTLNTAQNPAAKGDYILLYGTGIGTVSYAVLTGQAAPAPPAGFTGNYTFSIGGSASAPALYGGWAPNYAAFAQWDLQIPTSSASGQVPIIVTDTATGASSQTGATLFVK